MKRLRFPLAKAGRPWVWLGPLVLISIAYLLFWPVPIAATRWTPEPAPPLTGIYQQNRALTRLSRIGEDTLVGSEDIAFDSKGRAYFGSRDGSIWRLASRDETPKRVAALGGPILGMAFDPDDNH